MKLIERLKCAAEDSNAPLYYVDSRNSGITKYDFLAKNRNSFVKAIGTLTDVMVSNRAKGMSITSQGMVITISEVNES